MVRAAASTDVCFAPVLSLAEAPFHPHTLARQTFQEHDGMLQPSPSLVSAGHRPALRAPAVIPAPTRAKSCMDWAWRPLKSRRWSPPEQSGNRSADESHFRFPYGATRRPARDVQFVPIAVTAFLGQELKSRQRCNTRIFRRLAR